MRICFVIGAMNYSGAEKVLSMITSELSTKHDVSIILLEKQKYKEETLNRITTYGAKTTGNRILRVISRWNVIKTLCKRINPDIIVSFGNVCNINVIPALFGTRYKIVVCERNDPNYDPRSSFGRLIRNYLYRYADGFVFQTQEIRNYFSSQIQNKAVVIPNPIKVPSLKWDVSQCSKTIVTVARLDDYQKNHSLLIKSFLRVLEKHPDYKLKIYGDGPDKKKYKTLIDHLHLGESVILMGKTSSALDAICKDEIFILTSRYEGMPNALLEALSIGMPCVSTNCGGGGAKALFELSNSGSLVDDDEESIANAINELIDNKKLELQYSRNALKINEILSIGDISNEWIQYLERVLG